MRKRQKFVLTAIVLAVGIWMTQAAPLEWRYGLIGLLAGVTWMMTAWSLKEGLVGVEWLTIPLLPTLFSAGVGLFYILLPQHWLAQTTVVVLFGVGQYALLLTENIFSVAGIRTIPLFRAASAVGFVMTLLIGFLLYDTVLSFRLGFWVNAPLVIVISFLLLLPSLWSVELEERIGKRVMVYAGWLALMQGLLAVAISFWPVSLTVASLFLTAGMYVYLGISQHHVAQKLFKQTVWEYVIVGLVVLVTTLATSVLL